MSNDVKMTHSVDSLKSHTFNTLQGENCEMIYQNCCDLCESHNGLLAKAKSANPQVNGYQLCDKFRKCDIGGQCCAARFPMSSNEHFTHRFMCYQHKKSSARIEPCPMEEVARSASHSKDDLITDETPATLVSADSLDLYSGVDHDWQRIWLHIKPFGRRTPIKGARPAEDEDVSVASGDKVAQPTDVHAPDKRRAQNADADPAPRATVDSNTNQNNHCDAWTPACGDIAGGNRKSRSMLPEECRGMTIHAVRDAQLAGNSPASRGKGEIVLSSTSSGHKHLERDNECDRGLPSWSRNESSLLLRVGRVFVGGTCLGEQWPSAHKRPVDAAAGDGRDLLKPAWSSTPSVVASVLASLSAKDIPRPVKTRPGVVCSSQTSHGRHHHVDDNVNNSNNSKYYTSDDTDTDTERLMTNYASYDSVSRRATVHQRGVPSVTKRFNDTCDDNERAKDNMCRDDHAANPSKGDNGDNHNYRQVFTIMTSHGHFHHNEHLYILRNKCHNYTTSNSTYFYVSTTIGGLLHELNVQ